MQIICRGICIWCCVAIAEEQRLQYEPKIPRERNATHTHTLGQGLRGVVPFSNCERKGQDTAIDRGRQNKHSHTQGHTHTHTQQQ